MASFWERMVGVQRDSWGRIAFERAGVVLNIIHPYRCRQHNSSEVCVAEGTCSVCNNVLGDLRKSCVGAPARAYAF